MGGGLVRLEYCGLKVLDCGVSGAERERGAGEILRLGRRAEFAGVHDGDSPEAGAVPGPRGFYAEQ